MRRVMILVLALPLTLVAEEAKKPAEAAKPAAAAPAASAKEKAGATAELKVGTGVEKKEIAGAAESFKIAPDTKLYVWAKVTGVAKDGKVTLAFFKGGKEAFKKELSVAGSPWRLNAYKTFRAGDAGDWTAKALGGDGAELATVKFKVEIEKK